MNTLVCTRPGLLEYQEASAPELTRRHAILQMKRIGICGTDLHAFEGTQPYFTYPRILGHELAADFIEGDQALHFVPGEAVTIIPYFHCGHCAACLAGKTNCCVNMQVAGVHADGGMRDYFSVPVDALVAAQGLTYDELALVEPLSIGYHAVRRAGLKPNDWALVIGAGPIGLAVVIWARQAGSRVVVMDLNEDRLQFCQEHISVDHVIAAQSAKTMDELKALTGGDLFSVVFDATGSLPALEKGFEYIAHGGSYVLVGLQKEMIRFSHPEFHKREATLMSSRNATRQDFETVISHISKKKINPLPLITHRVSRNQVATEFSRWLDPASRVVKVMVNWEE